MLSRMGEHAKYLDWRWWWGLARMPITNAAMTKLYLVIAPIVGGIWAYILKWSGDPNSQIWAEIYLLFLATLFLGLYLYDRAKPREIKHSKELEYALTFQGLMPSYDDGNAEATFNIGIALINYSQHPIKYRVPVFDVDFGPVVRMPPLEKPLEGFLSRGSQRLTNRVPFDKDGISHIKFDQINKGSAKIVIEYGHPAGEFTRQLSLELDIYLKIVRLKIQGAPEFLAPAFKFQPQVSLDHSILSEKDEPIK